MATTEAVEKEEELDFHEQILDSMGDFASDHTKIDLRKHVEQYLAGESLELKVPALEVDEALKNCVEAFPGTDTARKTAQALGVMIGRHLDPEVAWWKLGQDVNVGNRDKERSGGGTARERYLAAIGKKGADNSQATALAPKAGRTGPRVRRERTAVHKGGGYYDLYVGGEFESSVRGERNVPDGFDIIEPEDATFALREEAA